MNVREKLETDFYKNSLPYPKRDDPNCKELRRAYNQETARLNELFKNDVLDELGVTDNPKADLLWSHAWDLGHSGGLHEVFGYATNLVGLIE
jgi:hypothetical protein